jgi:hypothetical protein
MNRRESTESPDLEGLDYLSHVSTENPFTKSDLMKSIGSYSAVLTLRRYAGFVAMMAFAALPALRAGSAKQPVQRDSEPSITVYNRGVEL